MSRQPAHVPLRRMKTHTAETGYVYQYYFVGQRPALAGEAEAPATEFIFDVSSDRKITFAVSVFLRDAAVAAWESRHARPLVDAERYGAAKMRLLDAFDHVENLRQEGRRLVVDAAALEELLASLGVE